MKKGDMVRHKTSGLTGTIVAGPYTKTYYFSPCGMDAEAASTIAVVWHDGWERTYRCDSFRRNHEVIPGSNIQEKNESR